jgi:hypothetical protein
LAVVMLAGFIGSLKITLTLFVRQILDAPLIGLRLRMVGAIVSVFDCVVKFQT